MKNERKAERNIKIGESIADTGSLAETARRFGISRERVRQIKDRLIERGVMEVLAVNDDMWKHLKKLTKEFGITQIDIARNVDCGGPTVSRVLDGKMRYIRNAYFNRYHTSIRIAQYILDVAEKKLDRTERVLYRLSKLYSESDDDGEEGEENAGQEDTESVGPAGEGAGA